MLVGGGNFFRPSISGKAMLGQENIIRIGGLGKMGILAGGKMLDLIMKKLRKKMILGQVHMPSVITLLGKSQLLARLLIAGQRNHISKILSRIR